MRISSLSTSMLIKPLTGSPLWQILALKALPSHQQLLLMHLGQLGQYVLSSLRVDRSATFTSHLLHFVVLLHRGCSNIIHCEWVMQKVALINRLHSLWHWIMPSCTYNASRRLILARNLRHGLLELVEPFVDLWIDILSGILMSG